MCYHCFVLDSRFTVVRNKIDALLIRKAAQLLSFAMLKQYGLLQIVERDAVWLPTVNTRHLL